MNGGSLRQAYGYLRALEDNAKVVDFLNTRETTLLLNEARSQALTDETLEECSECLELRVAQLAS